MWYLDCIVLGGRDEKEEVPLVCIGYKYKKKKTLVFLTTKGAGSIEKGEPYEARFPDNYENLCVCHVSRPRIILLYFKYSNIVDVHNQSRQADLSLEKNGLQRIVTLESILIYWASF